YVLDDLAEVDQIGRIENVANNRCHAAARGYGGTSNGNPGIIGRKDTVVTRGAYEPFVVLCEPIDTEFLVIVKGQLTVHRAQRHLRGFHVHFVEYLLYLRHHLVIAKNND